MNNRVLVLNQDFSPISVCTIQRAFVLVFLQKVELLKSYEFVKLRSISESFKAPSVVRLKKYRNVPYKTVKLTRQNVFRRDNYSCLYCGSGNDLTIDHVLPRAKGGKTTWKNVATSCKKCNSRKGDNLPHEVGINLKNRLFRPSFIMFLRNISGEAQDNWGPYLHSGKSNGTISKAM